MIDVCIHGPCKMHSNFFVTKNTLMQQSPFKIVGFQYFSRKKRIVKIVLE